MDIHHVIPSARLMDNSARASAILCRIQRNGDFQFSIGFNVIRHIIGGSNVISVKSPHLEMVIREFFHQNISCHTSLFPLGTTEILQNKLLIVNKNVALTIKDFVVSSRAFLELHSEHGEIESNIISSLRQKNRGPRHTCNNCTV